MRFSILAATALATQGLLAAGCLHLQTTQPPTPSEAAGQPSPAPSTPPPPPALDPVDPEVVGGAIGQDVKVTSDGVVKATWPRDAVSVTVDGVPFPTPAGLTSWAGFASAPGEAMVMVMGDTVVFQDEVDAAMDAAFAHGLEVTALHNHFFYDRPKVYFMHIGGHGEVATLAKGVRAIWEAIREVRAASAQPATSFGGKPPAPNGSLDADALGKLVGAEAKVTDGVVKVVAGREARMHGASFGGSMGLATWAAFTGSDELATIDGDFAMVADEVQPVLRSLRDAGIHVVALHNHMIGEQPAYYFTHFWGKGPAQDLARGFRLALDAQAAAGTAR